MRSEAAVRLLGSIPVARVFRLATGGALRVLAYHDVTDPSAFERQLSHLRTYYHPVSGAEVAWAVRASRPLSPRSVWITFDDARPGVFRHALPLLSEWSLPATVFACPGVVDTAEPYWWQVLDEAIAGGRAMDFDGRTWLDRGIVTHLKRVPDPRRRAYVESLRETLENERGRRIAVNQATSQQLRSWLDADLEVGNHTWDHPCLDTCSKAEQHRQILDADDWFRSTLNARAELFAYPNGDRTSVSNRLLTDNGYAVKLLFDHRLARASQAELSRLRIDADASPSRFAAVVSGAHPMAFQLVRSARRLEPFAATGRGRP